MVTEFGWFYIAGVTLLFFFWAYGIVSFVLDLKNVIVPKTKQYIRGRRRMKQQEEEENEREERERQLY